MPVQRITDIAGIFSAAILFLNTAGPALARPPSEPFVSHRTAVGVPTMRVEEAVPPPTSVVFTGNPSPAGTLLNELGRPARPIPARDLAAWRTESHRGVSPEREAWLQVWLGEYDLGRQEPDLALQRFQRAARLAPKSSGVYGLARLDASIAKFYAGMYEPAMEGFQSLLMSSARGYDRRSAAMWARHAAACWGRHEDNRRLGITQPERLDPLCGAAMMAVVLQAHGLPNSRAHVLKETPRTGEGSTMADLIVASNRLGLRAHPVAADEKGLRALPMPVIAHVERDHFITITKADRSAVWYACSDCGPWPGGNRKLTWTQFRAMQPGVYLAFSKWGSETQRAMETVAPQMASATKTLSLRAKWPIQGPAAASVAARRLVAALAGHVTTYVDPTSVVCGQKPESLHCSIECCPTDGPGSTCDGSGGDLAETGSSFGDPVNLATGEEEYTPAPDLIVYNPTGPSVVWQRLYNSLSNHHSSFGHSWSHPYNVGVVPAMVAPPPTTTGGSTGGTTGGTTGGPVEPPGGGVDENENQFQSLVGPSLPVNGGYVVLPNNARHSFSAPSTPSATTPVVTCTSRPGVPIVVYWKWDATTSSSYYEVVFQDRTRWITEHSGTTTGLLPIRRLVDKVGNYIQFTYANYNTDYEVARRLTEIQDSAGQPLLTMGLNAKGNIVSASDRYGRSVYYATQRFSTTAASPWRTFYDEVTQVSQIVPTGTVSPPIRYQHTYALENGGHNHVPFLKTISVPSPTGTGLSTSTIEYNTTLATVKAIVDANGNRREYSQPMVEHPSFPGTFYPDPNRTTITVKDPVGTVVYRYTVQFDQNMNKTATWDADGNLVHSEAYSDPLAPHRPSSVTDGNGRTWSMTYDTHGNIVTRLSPRGVTTTCTYDRTSNPLGDLVTIQEGSLPPTNVSYYHPTGLVQTVSKPTPGTGVGTVSRTYTYTALGNVASVTMPGNGGTPTRSVTFSYTTDGSYTQAEALGQPIRVSDENGQPWRTRYDARGNVERYIDPQGNTRIFETNIADQTTRIWYPATGQTGSGSSSMTVGYLYPGGSPTTTDHYDESGTLVRQTTMTYGKEGELLSRTGRGETSTNTYDPMYRVRTLADGAGGTTTYTYGLRGYLTQVDYPGATGTNFNRERYTAYDVVGNLLTRIDGEGRVTNYTYSEPDGKLSSIAYPATPAENSTFQYDAYGRMTTVTDGTGTRTKTFDADARVVSETTTYTGIPAKTVSYTYHPNGSRHTMVTPFGTWTYSYDARGACTGLVSPAGTHTAAYRSDGLQQTRTLPNGTVTQYGYNAVGNLNALENATSTGTVLSEFGEMTYNGVHALTSMVSDVPTAAAFSGLTTWGYDTKDRVLSEQSARNGGYTRSFAYSASGNPTTFAGSARTYNANNQSTGSGFVYEGNGNPTSYGGTALTFDTENRMVSRGSTWTASYRSDRLIGSRTVSGTKRYFLYDGATLLAELNDTGAASAIYVYAPDGLVARKVSSAWTYYTFDPQGSVAQRLNASQAVTTSSMYSEYGAETSTAPPGDPMAFNARWGYYLDRTTGFYLCQNRWYDPARGRWLTRDPIGYAGGINLYGYCVSSPVMQADPFGLNSSVDAYCRRYPSFCAELAKDLGMAGGLGGAGAGAANQLNGPGGQSATEVIKQCLARPSGLMDLGNAAHRIITQRIVSSGGGYVPGPHVPGVGRPDLVNNTTQHILEIKPATWPSIQAGLEQIERYIGGGLGRTGEIILYPHPYSPQNWPFTHGFN